MQINEYDHRAIMYFIIRLHSSNVTCVFFHRHYRVGVVITLHIVYSTAVIAVDNKPRASFRCIIRMTP